MAGYWRRPIETGEVLLGGGWLRTGDAARADEEGFVWIVDRADARFVSGGSVVYPGDVERVLMAHPAVADAGIVGVPSTGGGEVGAAFVVLAPGTAASAEELLGFARGRLPAHAVPATLTFVGELPRNSVGKLRRQALRSQAVE
jgi:acyl-CoA synthetase (AMP-forming)/AMP-acid ligase II